ncbi:hypothetical protein [Mesorhizobium sp.]|uniref:hypothetical protein n=1 Tax=Mesorhizobium sp. TaxID=1871066 RepID=UPI000FE462C4|nr:hypothetical protein [Mesorhizobium sp.]RWB24361.1 MAG: hypothetical protein EOQ41_27595 [Mesorhizobium sp.]RWD33970.1 MAG: hypothetical protein EOS34_17580 [Mesorhizobium sp.]RWD41084.1 MAG: hypothetical protein EOS35_29385 [Mesorhizobium sp.]RWD80595.1 MAG: hypothetical protein EOS48_18705 [Mesorhizobium sp.]RWE64619.1 MAG: hypothetical protein EOS62_28520 [Mesorhizobium sp.]
MTDGEEDDGPPLVARVLQFDRNSGELPDDYRDSLDQGACGELAKSLGSYLQSFASESKVLADVEVEGNRISVGRDDGTELVIAIYGPEIFEITRWPNPADAIEDGSMRFDFAPELESEVAVTLARRYVVNGTIEQENA